MPATQVHFYQDDDGEAPVWQWLLDLRQRDRQGFANCIARIEQLAAMGYDIRRPATDVLRDGIHELRAKHGHVQYRILYFYHGRNATVLAHAIIKRGSAVPPIEIERALRRKRIFEADPQRHTYEGDLPYA